MLQIYTPAFLQDISKMPILASEEVKVDTRVFTLKKIKLGKSTISFYLDTDQDVDFVYTVFDSDQGEGDDTLFKNILATFKFR